MADLTELLGNIKIGEKTSPRKGDHKVRALIFDTYGTVCDFHGPMTRQFDRFARERGVVCDVRAMTIAWRSAYAITCFKQAATESEFVPLRDIQRANLEVVMKECFP